MLLLESRIVPFVTLAADFVQAAQRGGVELKNGGSPAVYSGKYIGIVTLVPMRSEMLLQKGDSFFISVATFQK